MKPWLNVAEAAEYAGVCCDLIYDACNEGELTHLRLRGRRAIRVRQRWVDEWLESSVVVARNERGPDHEPSIEKNAAGVRR